MIKDVMVWLDGGIADEVRLAAAEDIARVFPESHHRVVPEPPALTPTCRGRPCRRCSRGGADGASKRSRRPDGSRAGQASGSLEPSGGDPALRRVRRRCCKHCVARGALGRHIRRNTPERLARPRSFGRGRSLRFRPAYFSGAGDETRQRRFRSHSRRLERQPGSRARAGRSHAVSAQGEAGDRCRRHRRARDRAPSHAGRRGSQSSQAPWDRRGPASSQVPATATSEPS